MAVVYACKGIIVFLSAMLGGTLASGLVCYCERKKAHEPWTGRNNRSKCPSCSHMLSWIDLVPVFSYLFLKGKCKYCGSSIPKRSFVIELCFSIVFAVVSAYYLFTYLY